MKEKKNIPEKGKCDAGDRTWWESPLNPWPTSAPSREVHFHSSHRVLVVVLIRRPTACPPSGQYGRIQG